MRNHDMRHLNFVGVLAADLQAPTVNHHANTLSVYIDDRVPVRRFRNVAEESTLTTSRGDNEDRRDFDLIPLYLVVMRPQRCGGFVTTHVRPVSRYVTLNQFTYVCALPISGNEFVCCLSRHRTSTPFVSVQHDTSLRSDLARRHRDYPSKLGQAP